MKCPENVNEATWMTVDVEASGTGSTASNIPSGNRMFSPAGRASCCWLEIVPIYIYFFSHDKIPFYASRVCFGIIKSTDQKVCVLQPGLCHGAVLCSVT